MSRPNQGHGDPDERSVLTRKLQHFWSGLAGAWSGRSVSICTLIKASFRVLLFCESYTL